MEMGRPLSTEAKIALVERLKSGVSVAALARQTGIRRKSLYQWYAAYLAFGASGSAAPPPRPPPPPPTAR
jgi:transposase-like protein